LQKSTENISSVQSKFHSRHLLFFNQNEIFFGSATYSWFPILLGEIRSRASRKFAARLRAKISSD
jgi:hypothetical protein